MIESVKDRLQNGERVRYADLKPYAFPDSLDELAGPDEGFVELPLHILWSPGSKRVCINTFPGIRKAYQAVLAEGSESDIRAFINKDILISMWQDLELPIHVAKGWEERFPELHGNMRAAW